MYAAGVEGVDGNVVAVDAELVVDVNGSMKVACLESINVGVPFLMLGLIPTVANGGDVGGVWAAAPTLASPPPPKTPPPTLPPPPPTTGNGSPGA